MSCKLKLFKQLHQQRKPLILGNVHDLNSALILENAGFEALGTTSWGVANYHGKSDGENLSFSQLLSLVKAIVENVSVPVSVDIEAGYSDKVDEVASNVIKLADVGAVGINIEDSKKHDKGLYGIMEQCARITKIRDALDSRGYGDFYINARTDTYLQQVDSAFDSTLSRSIAYIDSGADGIFVPGMTCIDLIKKATKELCAPLNILALPGFDDFSMLAKTGVSRISFGNAMSDYLISKTEKIANIALKNNSVASFFDHDPIRYDFST